MKKLALVLLILFAVSMIAATQEPTVYATTLYVEKVYPTTFGYRIDYRRQNSLMLATAYLPMRWFGGPTAMARLVYADDNAVPFIQIFWRDAEISRVVLYVQRNMNHLSWGRLPQSDGLQARFDLEAPEFQF